MDSSLYYSPRMFSEKIKDVFRIGLIGKTTQTNAIFARSRCDKVLGCRNGGRRGEGRVWQMGYKGHVRGHYLGDGGRENSIGKGTVVVVLLVSRMFFHGTIEDLKN